MASIRPKGKAWEVRFYAGRDGSGKPIRRSKIVHGTYRAAQAQADALEGSHGPDPKEITFGRVLAAWVAHGGRRSEPSQAKVARRVETYIMPALGNLPVASITAPLLEGFYRQCLNRGLSMGSVRNLRWDISGALRRAVRDGVIARSPADAVEMSFGDGHRVEPPTVADVMKLLAVLDGAADSFTARELALAVRVCLATAARRGEVCALQWRDVDFDHSAVHVRRNVVNFPGRLVVKETKSGTRRRVAVPPAVIDHLAAHRDTQGTLFPTGPTDFVLLGNPGGDPQNPEQLTQRFVRWRARAGVTFRFHDLRHLAASMFLADMPVFAASAAVGHRRTSTTTDTYGHFIDPELDRRTAEAVARRIDL